MKYRLLLLALSLTTALSFNAHAITETINSNISSQTSVGHSAKTGTFDISHLFAQNIIIDSVTVSFSFTDDSDEVILVSQTNTPESSPYTHDGIYYSRTSGVGYTYTYDRYVDSYYADPQETVTVSIQTQSGNASTANHPGTSTNSGRTIEDLVSGRVGNTTSYYYHYFYVTERTHSSGYNGDASVEFSLNDDSILYLMTNQYIEFDMLCGAGEDILFNGATMSLDYHVQPVPIPEPATMVLLGSSVCLLLRKKR